jgi:hypothetical protein
MTTFDAPIARGAYLGATTYELFCKTGANGISARVTRRTLFQRRGTISLYPDRLELAGWSGTGDLALSRADLRSVYTAFTELYGRFSGGLRDGGKPLILDTAAAGELYLLINRKAFLERTEDRRWEQLINTWIADPAAPPEPEPNRRRRAQPAIRASWADRCGCIGSPTIARSST